MMHIAMSRRSRLRDIVSVDRNTGEVLDGVVVYCGVKYNPYATGWIMNSQEALRYLAKDKELTGETYRVFLYLLSTLDFENWIEVPMMKIAEELDIPRQAVGRSIKTLERKEIIQRGEKIGRTYVFRLNPFYAWKGKVRNLDDYRRQEWDKETREMQRKMQRKQVNMEPVK